VAGHKRKPFSYDDQQTLNIDVWMIQRDLSTAPRYPLPEGYTMRFYREGDIETWVRIQQAAEPFLTPTAETFNKYLPDADKLPQRVMFLVDSTGVEVGSITAWNDSGLTGRDMGLIHWVGIVPESQGVGLAKPMLSAAIDVLRGLGYHEAWLGTGSARVPALNLYLEFGFEPYLRSRGEQAAWQSVAPRLKFAIHLPDNSTEKL
jgi:GNAT superfamily N-acetyltransferase